ncbi:MAG: methionyl-tRNA formyltransferase [Bacteroidia bacterium]|nr:hypothetical protein [Ignavibacteriaceae bacterium]MCK6615934.1 hypothetical protein [Ignavibacteriaceae bacterium]MCK6648619.1 methionyl-tRNA formyltransferase [Bacteroidia bacterium]
MKIPDNPRIILIGSVNSTLRTLKKLIDHKMNVIGVLGLDPIKHKNVSGYQNMAEVCAKNILNYYEFTSINDINTIDILKNLRPDIIFVVGLSQLIKSEVLSIPKVCCIGFHPTKLPNGRGRGTLAWLVMKRVEPAATFFVIDEGMDSGPILVQTEYKVEDNDYAIDVLNKNLQALDQSLDKLLPQIKSGNIILTHQDHSAATYCGKRNPEDGLINWANKATNIFELVRATSDPLPGAFTFYDNSKIIIEKAEVNYNQDYFGVVGRILKIDEIKGALIQTGEGTLWISKVKGIDVQDLKVGKKLGLDYLKLFNR